MSLGLTKTKRRIASVKSTQKITKAMEMVATVKVKRFRKAYDESKDYVDGLKSIMAKLLAYDAEAKSHYALPNEDDLPDLYILITSDLGLCAAYNTNLYKFVEEHVRKDKDILAVVGQKGTTHYGSSQQEYAHINNEFSASFSSMEPRLINEACDRIKAAFNGKKVRRVFLISTKYVNSLSFVPELTQLLPLELEDVKEADEEYRPPLFEPSPRRMIHLLLPQYLGGLIYFKAVESQLSEQASRRTAMDNANDNADELLNKLTIEYNKARQGAITQEITEVVSGSVNA